MRFISQRRFWAAAIRARPEAEMTRLGAGWASVTSARRVAGRRLGLATSSPARMWRAPAMAMRRTSGSLTNFDILVITLSLSQAKKLPGPKEAWPGEDLPIQEVTRSKDSAR